MIILKPQSLYTDKPGGNGIVASYASGGGLRRIHSTKAGLLSSPVVINLLGTGT